MCSQERLGCRVHISSECGFTTTQIMSWCSAVEVAADDWDSCVLWSVREGIPETRPGFSDEAESISFLIYAAPPEIRWDCSNRTVPDCGDGHLTGSEDCDDGNSEDFDGCSANCTLEAGFICQSPGSPCIATTCGDGVAGLGLPQKFY